LQLDALTFGIALRYHKAARRVPIWLLFEPLFQLDTDLADVSKSPTV
jgi:hypothetical protein